MTTLQQPLDIYETMPLFSSVSEIKEQLYFIILTSLC